jgi:hypothetical protein
MDHLDGPNSNNLPPILILGKEEEEEEEEGSKCRSFVDIPVFQYESRTG